MDKEISWSQDCTRGYSIWDSEGGQSGKSCQPLTTYFFFHRSFPIYIFFIDPTHTILIFSYIWGLPSERICCCKLGVKWHMSFTKMYTCQITLHVFHKEPISSAIQNMSKMPIEGNTKMTRPISWAYCRHFWAYNTFTGGESVGQLTELQIKQTFWWNWIQGVNPNVTGWTMLAQIYHLHTVVG